MSALLDADAILSESEQWTQLEEKWGTPVDLDTEEDWTPGMKKVLSTLDLMKSTFDSSFLFKKVRSKVERNLSKKSMDYKDFLQDLNKTAKNTLEKEFYFINGQILSACSVEDICDNIDDIFRSVERLCSATSTVRINKVKNKPCIPEVVQCSISTSDLSFDDTVGNLSEKEKADSDDVDRYIDEIFSHLNSTLVSLSNENLDRTSSETVTTLVRKFSHLLKSPEFKFSPRKRRQCCEKFKDLADFWQNLAFENGN